MDLIDKIEEENIPGWKKGDKCLTPYSKKNHYRPATVVDTFFDHLALVKFDDPVVEFVDGKFKKETNDFVRFSLLYDVPEETEGEVSEWHVGCLCFVNYKTENVYRLATFFGNETDEDGMGTAFIQVSGEKGLTKAPMSALLAAKKREIYSKNKGLKRKIAFGVAGAAVVGVLTPIAVPAAVGLLGFGAGGIIAGTPAAAIMASYGGAVASGSLCAILQSIGAVGLGATGTLVSGAVGTAVGGTIGLAAGEVFDQIKKKTENEEKRSSYYQKD